MYIPIFNFRSLTLKYSYVINSKPLCSNNNINAIHTHNKVFFQAFKLSIILIYNYSGRYFAFFEFCEMRNPNHNILREICEIAKSELPIIEYHFENLKIWYVVTMFFYFDYYILPMLFSLNSNIKTITLWNFFF